MCVIYTNEDKDKVYIPDHETWYCIECQDKGLIWYPSHGSEEDRRQHDYINWDYKEKEKFFNKKLCMIKIFMIKRIILMYNERIVKSWF